MHLITFIRTKIESVLNKATMYVSVLYALFAITVGALILSGFGVISYSLPRMILSLGILLPVSYGASRLFAYTFRTVHNPESWLITALILFCLVLPPSTGISALDLGLIAVLAVAGKYILAYRGRHIFNPAALAVVISGYLGLGHAAWWIATPPLFPVILIAGGLVVLKLRRYSLVISFFVAGVITIAFVALSHHLPVSEAVTTALTSYPILFLGTIMLTEPLTSPTTRKLQIIYGTVVGVLAQTQLYSWLTPELALVLGNTIAFAASPKRRLSFILESVTKLSSRTHEIILRPDAPLNWHPGQYLELALPHHHSDFHGTRRMFSIASTPAEGIIRLGISHGEKLSSFKQALVDSPVGSELSANVVGGDFTIDTSTKPLIFLAGGIGITPFRAMIQQLADSATPRKTTILYFGRTPDALVWSDYFENIAANHPSMHFIPVSGESSTSWTGETGRMSQDLLQRLTPDLKKSISYVSGPPSFVESAKSILYETGVSRKNVITDYFSGY